MRVIELDTPYEGKLETDRVGQILEDYQSPEVGETVNFYYYGGSESGVRHVLVVKTDDSGFEGPNLERDGGYRRYLRDNCGALTVVEPFVEQEKAVSEGNVKRIRFDSAGEALLASLTGDQLAALYGQYVALEGDGTEFDAASGEVVVLLPPAKSKVSDVDILSQSVAVTLQNKAGNSFTVYFYASNPAIGYGAKINATPEELRDELVKFLA